MCYCDDFERPKFYSATRHKARKEHKCCECRNTIKPLEFYERVFGKWDEVEEFKTCYFCLSFREYVQQNIPCFCWTFGDALWQGAEVLEEYSYELPGLKFAGLRILAEGKRYYKMREDKYEHKNKSIC